MRSATAAAWGSTRGRRFPPEVLSDDEVRALMEACGEDSPTSLRNRALLVVMYRAGLRIREALALDPKDIDFDGGAIRVLWAKGGRARTVGIDPAGMAELQRWLTAREKAARPVGAPVFCTSFGAAVTPGYVRRLLPGLARIAGIRKRVHAHGLRHTHAAQLREEGVDIGIISKQLGHRSIATTARYLDHIAPYAVVEAMRARCW